MKLYCVRHGEALGADVDPERALTEKGRADILKVAMFLEQSDVHVPHIMHSEKLRAKQTAEIFASVFVNTELTECASLLSENADVSPLVDMIKTWDDDTMLVGHLPFMAQLVSALVVGNQHHSPIVNYPPGSVVCLDHYEHDRWIVNWLLRPSIVPA